MAQRNKALPGRDPDSIQRAKSGLTVRLERAFRPLISHKVSSEKEQREPNQLIHLLIHSIPIRMSLIRILYSRINSVQRVHNDGSPSTTST